MSLELRAAAVALQTIVVKEVRRFMRIWPQTLLPPAITMALYFVIFGNLIGSRIGEMGGFDYMQYIVPGLIMMSVITNSYSNVVSSFFSTKFQRSIEELMVAPVSAHVILVGFVVGGVLRGLAVGFIVTLLSLFFTKLSVHHLGLTALVVLLTATVFALGGFINAVYARSFDDISIIPTFVLTPLTYLGGVFYSIDLLPEFWQNVSLINPILHMVNAFRFGILGVSDISIGIALGMMLLAVVLLYGFAWRLLVTGTGMRQ
ncbi:ABC-2 type transport system permease protein [Atopomonas hussainii]|uniref:Transport permease protein n=1 Tax=Atopomonas hussainii TaxID=1429083 RepID=A0A1H7PKG5_9GAMM|nr:ABC transporter permease [Atopomonas hussainii]SEL36281.1 ABC-2 type transport system permease protein [Atopomonas hussainii]